MTTGTKSPRDAILRLTKKYIIDVLNNLCFSETLDWGGVDQFNALLLLENEEDLGERIQQRGGLLVHNRLQTALRVLVTISDANQTRVCYRVTGLNKNIEIFDPARILRPMEYTIVDFSLADSNMGVRQDSSYSFSYNGELDGNSELSKITSLLRFLLSSHFMSYDDTELFEDFRSDIISFPPYPGDPHFKPIFMVSRG